MNTFKNNNIGIKEVEEALNTYSYQTALTPKLDELKSDFDQNIINEIVLWKVNRYAELDDGTIDLINSVKDDEVLDEPKTREILEKLLDKNQRGVRLAMASTILRFRNPRVYQIIDQRAYRFINGKEADYGKKSVEEQIDLYIEYLNQLRQICQKKEWPFDTADRYLYVLDKKYNKGVKLKSKYRITTKNRIYIRNLHFQQFAHQSKRSG